MPFLPLIALTLGTFGIGATELMIQGLLPEIAADLDTSIPKAGLLVTGYALGVTLGGPLVAILTVRLKRKTILLLLMGVFIVGNLMCAIAPNYPFMIAARIVASLCHGAFVGIGSVVAVDLASAERRASAIALMWAGFTVSSILGVPFGTALGHAFGWRVTFWVVTAVGIAAEAGIAIFLPPVGRAPVTRLAQELRVLAKPKLLLALALGTMICAGAFGVLTFIAPILTEVAAISPATLPVYLLFFGVGGLIGMQVGGRAGDRNLMASIIAVFAGNIVVYFVLLLAFHSATPALIMMFVWGASMYFIAAPIQLRVVESGREAPNLASTLLQSSFNLGIAIGPLVAAVALSLGMSFALLPVLGAAFSAGGLALALASRELDRRAALAVQG
ncbi:MAG TPA: MFS transporter [Roseiarcus sp.]|nr:MFS transporter [Roseiarcus sp.]